MNANGRTTAPEAVYELLSGQMLERMREDVDARLARRDYRRFVRDSRELLGTIRRGVSA